MKKHCLLLLALLTFVLNGHCEKPAPTGKGRSTMHCIENPTAHDVMQRSNSTFDKDAASFLDDKAFQNLRSTALDKGYRNDQPSAFRIRLPKNVDSLVWVVLTCGNCSIPVLSDTITLKEGQQWIALRNLVPQRNYCYQVEAGGKTVTSGIFSTEGQLRMIGIDSGWNIRDLGGWKGWKGHTVRYEQIYRGGSLGGQNRDHETYFLTDDDIRELHRIGIRAHLDLRAMPGKGAWPKDEKRNAFSLGYTMLRDATFMNTATDFALYHAMGCSAAVGNVAWVISQLREGRPVYFHCRTGADRTGVMGYTLLGLLGCDKYAAEGGGNQLALDYELTSLGMDEEGTIEYNTTGKHSGYYSNRYANQIATMGYDYFRAIRSLESPKGVPALRSFMEQCYYYLNRYFRDNNVPEAGRVFINKSDLDWFVNFMLGITDREGNLLPGHKKKFVGPSWAVEDENNTLEAAYTTAHEQQYEYAK